MLNDQTRRKIVADLHATYRTRKQIRLLTQTYPAIEIEDAYRIQQAFIADRETAGARVRGYKVGLTSKVMQAMSGATEPDYSLVTDDLFFDEGGTLPASMFFDPLIELEIAFVLRDRLEGPGILPVDVVRATEFVLPAIEIVDFRIAREPGISVIDTIADLAACGGVVLGCNPRRLDQIDIRTVSGRLSRNGALVNEGVASAVLGNPVNAIAWLANKLGEFGVAFEPGRPILAGSFVRAIPVSAGDTVTASFDQGFGDVTIAFD